MAFWDNVDLLVKAHNTTYRWLSSYLDVAETTVSSWRKNGVLPRADHANAIAEALATSVAFLVKGYETKVGHGDDVAELVRLYRSLSPELQAVALGQIKLLAGKTVTDVHEHRRSSFG